MSAFLTIIIAMEEKNTQFITQTFNTIDEMTRSSINWKYAPVYQLKPHAFEGKNDIAILPSLQLSYGKRSGGILYSVKSPKGMLSVAVILRADGKVCFGNLKLKKGDILFFDDKTPNILVTSDMFEAAILSIPRNRYRKYTQTLSANLGKVIDDDGSFADALLSARQQFQEHPESLDDIAGLQALEERLFKTLSTITQKRTAYVPKLTKGERIALKIRDRIYKKVTKKVTISSLAEEFGVSEQTLQNAFKSLFDMTPNRFLRNLKLNHVRKVLIGASPIDQTIVQAANRWGFTHMGHFSRYYTDLFGENPSVTLCHTFINDTQAK